MATDDGSTVGLRDKELWRRGLAGVSARLVAHDVTEPTGNGRSHREKRNGEWEKVRDTAGCQAKHFYCFTLGKNITLSPKSQN